VAAAVLAVLVAILAHEGGHLAAAEAFGLPGVVLHYESSTHALEKRSGRPTVKVARVPPVRLSRPGRSEYLAGLDCSSPTSC
jgi:hypothetical protein